MPDDWRNEQHLQDAGRTIAHPSDRADHERKRARENPAQMDILDETETFGEFMERMRVEGQGGQA